MFEKFGMCVWLVDNKIVGWKVKNDFILSSFHYNTRNWYPFKCFHNFKKWNLYLPIFLHNFVFRILSKIWFRQWKHHELFRGFRAY